MTGCPVGWGIRRPWPELGGGRLAVGCRWGGWRLGTGMGCRLCRGITGKGWRRSLILWTGWSISRCNYAVISCC